MGITLQLAESMSNYPVVKTYLEYRKLHLDHESYKSAMFDRILDNREIYKAQHA